jgi:hypothetical protein
MALVAPASFLHAMRSKWADFGNVGSPALDQVWLQIAETLNRQTEQPSLPRPVIPAELGAGKTTCAKLWCSMLPREGHPGVLVVVRTISQADEYARDINLWAGATVPALAYHSDVKPRPAPSGIQRSPILVVCHRGYELALDQLLVEEPERYDQLMRFRTGQRKLAIVDEALDQVYVARLSPQSLHQVGGLIRDPRILGRHLGAHHVLDSAYCALLEAPENGYRVVSAEALLARAQMTVEQADAELVALWQDVRTSNRVKPEVRRIVKETLTMLRRHLAAYRWTESERSRRALIGSRLLLPPDAGQVILDATGQLNNVYLGRPDAYAVQTMPSVRDYRAVRLCAARTQGTGKTAMLKDGQTIIQRALESILGHYGERALERRVLVVTDLGSEEKVRTTWATAGFLNPVTLGQLLMMEMAEREAAPQAAKEEAEALRKDIAKLDRELARALEIALAGEGEAKTVAAALRAKELEKSALQAKLEHLDGLQQTAEAFDLAEWFRDMSELVADTKNFLESRVDSGRRLLRQCLATPFAVTPDVEGGWTFSGEGRFVPSDLSRLVRNEATNKPHFDQRRVQGRVSAGKNADPPEVVPPG